MAASSQRPLSYAPKVYPKIQGSHWMAWSCKNLKSDALERFKKKAVFLWVRFFVKIQFPNPKTDFGFFLGKSKNGSWIHKIHPQGGFYGSNPNPDFWDSQSERIARLFLNPYLSCFFPTNWKNNSSASVLNSYNFTILRSVFYSRNICLIHFVHSFVAYVAFSSCLRRENQFVIVIFFPEEHEDMPLSR